MNYARSLLTVVTPASDYSLVDLATVKDELGITDTTIDTRLTRWIRETKDAIESYLGRTLRAETVRETFRGTFYSNDAPGEHFPPYFHGDTVPMSSGLVLRRYPIVSVTSVTESGTALDPALDYEVDSELGALYRLSGDSRCPWYAQLVVVEYIGGYSALSDVPGDIVEANLTLMKHRRAAQTREPGLRAMTVPGVLERQWWVPGPGEQTALPQEVCGVLDGYRDPRM